MIFILFLYILLHIFTNNLTNKGDFSQIKLSINSSRIKIIIIIIEIYIIISGKISANKIVDICD